MTVGPRKAIRENGAYEEVSSGPISAGERVVVADVLRGFALFGILVVNMAAFKYPFFGDLGTPDGPLGRGGVLDYRRPLSRRSSTYCSRFSSATALACRWSGLRLGALLSYPVFYAGSWDCF